MDIITLALSRKYTDEKIDTVTVDQNTETGVGEIKIWTGTLAEYEAITEKDPNIIYFVRG